MIARLKKQLEKAAHFGREARAAELTSRLRASAPRPRPVAPSPDQFLILMGVPGSGKSSLVRAGVMPRPARRTRCPVASSAHPE
ncbi:hypothetical protein AB0M25_13925 [Streptomyces griseomycini]|uniref:nSTAND1 domain-containing NTPase n=1 Tax=Streptomyces griseomycini TaxID=66895 RepID=UPI00343791CC